MRAIWILGATLAAALSQAATITVTKPADGEYLGRSNNVQINITGSNREATVVVTATNVANPANRVSVERKFTPEPGGDATGTIPLNFGETSPQGAYNIQVIATEPGNTYNTVPPIPVIVDIRNPKIVDFDPISNSFVDGTVNIRATLDEPNIKEWRVRVNNSDIPNNSGNTETINVVWDASSILTDGTQNIEFRVEDLAGNVTNRNVSVTLDRRAPVISILAPANGTTLFPRSSLAVVLSVQDQFANAIDRTGVDVTLVGDFHSFLARVSRRSIRTDGNRIVWTGRVQSKFRLPGQFKLVVTAVDKAGNVAARQEVVLRVQGQ